MIPMINTGEVFVDFLEKKVSELRKNLPKINGRLKNLNLIKIQDKNQDKKVSNLLRHYFDDSEIIDWDFLNKRMPDGQYSSASSFFSTHDSDNLQYLFEEIGKVVVPKGLLFAVDYNMNWIRSLPDSQSEEVFKEYFNHLENERKEMFRLKQEHGEAGTSTCYRLHTRYSLENHVEAIERAGFKTIQAESDPREKPKIFLYIGERK